MPRRISPDRCPGVLRPFSAADGAIVRLRVPGGRVSTATLLAVTRLAQDFGQPFVQATSRGNLQLRGLSEPVPEAFVDAVGALGLLPSATHDRVRNVLAEPDRRLDDIVLRLDEEIQADARLAELSGRWIFAVSMTTDWLGRMPYDVAFQRITATRGALLVGPHRMDCAVEDAPRRLVEVAALFTEIASPGGAWNVRDLPSDHRFFRALGAHKEAPAASLADENVDDGPDDTIALHLPLGLLDEPLAAALAVEAEDVVVTPERSIVVRQWREGVIGREAVRRLREAGFVTDASSAAALLSACIGAPWCRRTTTPTLQLARDAAELIDHSEQIEPMRTHVVGCGRACGRPSAAHRLVEAPADVTAVLSALETPTTAQATPAAPTRG